MRRTSFRLGLTLSVLAQAVLCLLLTAPVLFQLGRNRIWAGTDDAFHVAWAEWWFQKAMTTPGLTLFECPYILAPEGAKTLLHTFTLTKCLMAWPLSRVLDWNDVVNVLMALTFFGSALTALSLAYDQLRSWRMANLAAILFAYSPYHFAHANGHMNLATIEWIPLYMLCLARLLRIGPAGREDGPVSLWWAAGLGGSLALSFLSDFYYFFFLLILTPVMMLFTKRMAGLRQTLVAGGTFLAVSAPVLVQMLLMIGRHGLPTQLGGSSAYSLDLISVALPSDLNHLTGVLGGLFQDLRPDYFYEGCERIGYLGIAPLLLGGIAIARLPGYRTWKGLAISAWVLSLGPSLQVMGMDTGIPLPAALLPLLPLVSFIRAPNRFQVFVFLGLGVLIGALWLRWEADWSPARRRVGFAALVALVLLDYNALPIPMVDATVPPVFRELARQPGYGAVFVMPDHNDFTLSYYQATFDKPLVTGFVSRFYRDDLERMKQRVAMANFAISLQECDVLPRAPALRDALHEMGVEWLVVDTWHLVLVNTPFARWTSAMEELLPDGPFAHDARYVLYHIASDGRSGWYPTMGWKIHTDDQGLTIRIMEEAAAISYVSRTNEQEAELHLPLIADGALTVKCNGRPCAVSKAATEGYTIRTSLHRGINDFVITAKIAGLLPIPANGSLR